MQLEKNWTSSNKIENQNNDDLSALTGIWNSQIEITTTNPAHFSQGPLKQTIIIRK